MSQNNDVKEMKFNVTPTVSVINDMIRHLYKTAKELEYIANKMMEDDDISRTAEAANTLTNCIQNLRIDLLITRPIREFDLIMKENGIKRKIFPRKTK